MPVTAMPYFGSGSSTEWPPRMGMPASSALLCPPSRMRASVSRGSAWVGKATRLSAKSGRAPMAQTSERALAAAICPKANGSSTTGGKKSTVETTACRADRR